MNKKDKNIEQTSFLSRRLESAIDFINKTNSQRHKDYGVLVISAFLGIIIGLSVVVFHFSLEIAANFFSSVFQNTNEYVHAGRYIFPLITALGGLLVGFLNTRIFHQLPNHDLHSVVHAIESYDGKIHWGHSIKSIITAAITITSGGGGGREGPTIMLGSSLGSGIAQALRLKTSYIKILCAAGAAAAISGIFNAPLAGIIFSLEAISGEMALGLFIPIVISSVLATATTRLILGSNVEIITPIMTTPQLWEYALIIMVGIISGFAAIYYIKIYRYTTLFVKKHLNKLSPMMRPMIGGLLVGIMATLLPTLIETSYTPVNLAIAGKVTIVVAIATIILKPINNALTLSSGGAGGTFAPVLKVGAMLGSLLAFATSSIMGGSYTGLFAVTCASAMLAGSWRLPLTAAVLLCEISHNYEFLLPLLLATVISVFIVERVKGIETFNPLDKGEDDPPLPIS